VTVLITGGSGSLGQALLHRYVTEGQEELIVYSRDEWKQSQLRRMFPEVRFMLGDVRDYDRLLIATRGVETIIHAAAYKQVPSAEANVDEAIATNVLGSRNVARAAVHNNVNFVLGISTDKACQPVNAYGETKALMEKLFQQADNWGDTIFNCVRYGNVLGSRGSIVPLFRAQVESRTFTLTDANMTRFWMTLDEAVDLVFAALRDGMANLDDSAVVVPQVPASSMWTLVEAVVARWGTGDIADYEIEHMGTRPGEKWHEQLIHRNESLRTKQPSEHFPYYQVLAATSDLIDENAEGFEYRSDEARQLTVAELVEKLASCE
jgi:UDP-N-acetylglucosamine 4,6-dehydratase